MGRREKVGHRTAFCFDLECWIAREWDVVNRPEPNADGPYLEAQITKS